MSLGGARAAAELRNLIAERAKEKGWPFVAAIDGRSGVGKSTLARMLAGTLDAAVIDGDDFYAGGVSLLSDSPTARAAACIDWPRQRLVLAALRSGIVTQWRAFDWEVFDGSLRDQPTMLAPPAVIILEGVYSARPELADLIDLRVMLDAPDAVRLARLEAREGIIGPWERQWHEAEELYFREIMPPEKFDVIVQTG